MDEQRLRIEILAIQLLCEVEACHLKKNRSDKNYFYGTTSKTVQNTHTHTRKLYQGTQLRFTKRQAVTYIKIPAAWRGRVAGATQIDY